MKTPDPDSFINIFLSNFKEEIKPILHKPFWRAKIENTFSNSFYKEINVWFENLNKTKKGKLHTNYFN